MNTSTARGLWDPRQRMVMWPEPNDDPNIPYAWGEGGLGYALNGYHGHMGNNGVTVTSPAMNDYSAPVNYKNVAYAVLGVSLAFGVKGFIDGFNEGTSTSDRLVQGLKSGLLNATIVGPMIKR